MTFIPTILVVDDEKRIRSGCVKMLTEDGFPARPPKRPRPGWRSSKRSTSISCFST